MIKFNRFFAACAIISLIASSCGSTEPDPYASVIEEALSSMSIRQKVAQLYVIDINRQDGESRIARNDSLITEYGIGGVIIMRGPVAPFIERINHMQSISKYPLLVSVDAEWGAAMRFAEYPAYPRQAFLGGLDDGEDLIYRMGQNVGKELKDLKINVNYAPVTDVCDVIDDPADGHRSFSDDPKKVARYASAYMRGMQSEGIFACAKHYPGHGHTRVDSHYALPHITYGKDSLNTYDLYPFKQLIKEGVDMIMIAHLSVPAIDPSGVPMSISEKCIQGLLRKKQKFNGVIITDAVGMNGLSEGREELEVELAVYKAGADMMLMPHVPMQSIEAIADSVKTGVFSEEDLNDRVRRVLRLKAKAGLLDPGYNRIVENLDQKIEEATLRDSLLIKEIEARLDEKIEPAPQFEVKVGDKIF